LSLRDPVPDLVSAAGAATEAGPSMSLSVRAARGAPASVAPRVGEAIGRVDRNITIAFIPLKQQVETGLVQERIIAMPSGFFGGLALLLGALGLCGVTSCAVSWKRNEIGIRMAWGASGHEIVHVVLRHVGPFVGAGLVGCGLVSLSTSRYVEALLYGVTPHDAVTLIIASVVFAAVVTAGRLAYGASRGAPRCRPGPS
jgi:ABC-type antimicrobial peptide transport system permease subunit